MRRAASRPAGRSRRRSRPTPLELARRCEGRLRAGPHRPYSRRTYRQAIVRACRRPGSRPGRPCSCGTPRRRRSGPVRPGGGPGGPRPRQGGRDPDLRRAGPGQGPSDHGRDRLRIIPLQRLRPCRPALVISSRRNRLRRSAPRPPSPGRPGVGLLALEIQQWTKTDPTPRSPTRICQIRSTNPGGSTNTRRLTRQSPSGAGPLARRSKFGFLVRKVRIDHSMFWANPDVPEIKNLLYEYKAPDTIYLIREIVKGLGPRNVRAGLSRRGQRGSGGAAEAHRGPDHFLGEWDADDRPGSTRPIRPSSPPGRASASRADSALEPGTPLRGLYDAGSQIGDCRSTPPPSGRG